MSISAYQALHGPPDGPYHAVRIEAEGRSIAYTGDSEWTDALIEAASGTDLFIAEAYFRDKAIETHLSLSTIEDHLPQLRTRKLVVTHMSEDMLARLDTIGHEVAEDGKVITIP